MTKEPRRFVPNIEKKGRIIRALTAMALLGGGFATLFFNWILSLVLFVSGVFVLFEALRGWCVMRACGVKTKF
jgi:hypothetical protein